MANCQACTFTAEASATTGLTFDIPANPDLAGPGMIIAFMATAWLTFIFTVLHYVTGCVHSRDLNTIDHGLLKRLWKHLPAPIKGWLQFHESVMVEYFEMKRPVLAHHRWKRVLEAVVLTYSDQQIITGISVLAAGYSMLRCGEIVVYHWQIMIYTAWFSSVTHLATLSALRSYFRDKNPLARHLRCILMLCVLSLLIVALIPTADGTWGSFPAFSAWCYYHNSTMSILSIDYRIFDVFHDDNAASVVVSILVLVFSYAARAVKLYDIPSNWIKILVNGPSAWILDYMTHWNTRPAREFWWHLLSNVLLIQLSIVRALKLLYMSFIWEVLWLCFALVWGTTHLFSSRSSGSTTFPTLNSESEADEQVTWNTPEEDGKWTFSQFLAVLLLAVPILSAFGFFFEKEDIDASRPQSREECHRIPQTQLPQPAMEQARTETSLTSLPPIEDKFDRFNFHVMEFDDFLWFKLFIWVLVSGIVCLLTLPFVFYKGPNGGNVALGMLYARWISALVFYGEVYMLPCCLLEKYCGRGRHEEEYTPSLFVRVLVGL